MANLIENWLNNEIKLSKNITCLEEDFCNGFLFGEVLNKYRLITNFFEYKDKNDEDSTIKNLKNLELAFKNLKIKLDKGRIFDIKSKKKGVAARFLYQIKMFISKKNINFDDLMMKQSTEIKHIYSQSKYPKANLDDLFKKDALQKKTLPRLNTDTSIIEKKPRIYSSINPSSRRAAEKFNLPQNLYKPSNKLNETNSLIHLQQKDHFLNPIKRFEEFQKIQEKRIKEAQNKQNNFFKVEHKVNKERIQGGEKEFHLKKKQKDNLEKTNFLAQVQLGKKFQKKLENERNFVSNNFKKIINEQIQGDEKNTYIEIDKFEKNLSKLGLDLSNIDSKLKRFDNKLINCDVITAKLREQIHDKEQAKKEKERRQRKIILDQNKLANDKSQSIMNNINSSNVIDKSRNDENSRLKRVDYEKVRELHSREIQRDLSIKALNVNLNQSNLSINSNMNENKFSRAKNESNNLLENSYSNQNNFNKYGFLNDLYGSSKLLQEENLLKKVQKRGENLPVMRDLAEYIIDFAEQVYNYETENKVEKIPLDVWTDYVYMFINDQPFGDGYKLNSKNYFELSDETAIEKTSKEQSFAVNDSANKIENKFERKERKRKIKSSRKQDKKNWQFIESENKSLKMRTNINNLQINYDLFEENEFLDYIYFLGNFKENSSDFENKEKILDFFEVMRENENSNKNYFSKSRRDNFKNSNIYDHPSISNKDYEPKSEDIENLTIPENNSKNFLFSDIINIILEIRFSENRRIKEFDYFDSTNLFSHIPLKIVILGKDFSGKKTQVKSLMENFKLIQYDLYEIITSKIDILEKLDIPIEENPKYKLMKKAEIDKLTAEREQEKEKIEWMKDYILKFKSFNEQNIEYDDNLLIDFLLDLIRKDFTEKDEDEYIEELKNKNKRKKEIIKEIEKLKEEKNEESKEEKIVKNKKTKEKDPINKTEEMINNLNQELHKLKKEWNEGFVLINFPRTIKQAKLLEKRINNNINPLEKPKNDYDIIKDNSLLLLDNNLKAPKTTKLINSCFDSIFTLEIEDNELIRRIQNRKIDPLTENIYHMDDYPPSSEDKKLIDRLEFIEEEPIINKFKISSKKIDDEILKMNKYYLPFGTISLKQNLNINAFNRLFLEQIFVEREKLSSMNLQNFNNDDSIFNQSTNKKDLSVTKQKSDISKKQANFINEEILKVLNNLLKIKEEKESDLLMENMEVSYNESNNNISLISKNAFSKDNNFTRDIHTPSDMKLNLGHKESIENIKETSSPLETKNKMKDNLDKSENDFPNANMDDDISNINILTMHNNILMEENLINYNKKLEEAKKKISNGSIDKLYNDWVDIFEKFSFEFKLIFKNLSEQKENIVFNFDKIQDKFIDYLKRESPEKYIPINNLKDKYNKFIEEYPSLVFDENVKIEFHQDVSQMQDLIWEIIQNRKTETISYRKNIISTGYIETEMETFYSNYLEKFFILETEKFYSTVTLISEYYSYLDSKFKFENFEFRPIDILIDPDMNKIPLFTHKIDSEENLNFPRIEKLHKNCHKILILYEETKKFFDKQKSPKNLQNLNDSSGLRRTQRFTRRYSIIENKKDLVFLEEELKNTIKSEKNKFKYRVNFLRNWGIQNLKKLKNISEIVFKKMDDWIISGVKHENNALNNLVFLFDDFIEIGRKIYIETELDVFDIYKRIDVDYYFQISVIFKNYFNKLLGQSS